MIISTIDESQRTATRIAGLAFPISFVTVVAVNFGIFARLIVRGNPAETARNILAHETLFRIGVAGDMVYCVAVVVLLTALYVILKPVSQNLALLAAFGRVVHGTLIVRGNATATANNIPAHETLFRVDIVVDLISEVIFIFVLMALYRLLSGVNKTHASLMVILVLVSVAVGFVNELSNVAALTLFRGADSLAVFEKTQRDALAMLFL